MAGKLQASGPLHQTLNDWLEDSLTWFDENLPVPSWRLIPERAQFWYRADAQKFVSRMWDLVWLLREGGLRVDVLKTSTPGRIVYGDEHQIAAIPDRRVGFRR